MRNRFDEQLEQLNTELARMGALCQHAIASSVKALINNDSSLTEHVINIDSEIDQMERDIEDICMKLILSQQPVAHDLRMISSALKMISDMERIGDQASDIAEITRFIGDDSIKNSVHIKKMAIAATKMVNDSVESFINRDLRLALSVIDYDDEVDSLFYCIKTELVKITAQNPEKGEFCADLLMIAKYLERIGDHAENIAQWVKYSITGKH